MLIEMYAVFAQVEIEKKEKRQKEGIAAKKLRGEWDDYGRPAAMEWSLFTAAYAQMERNEVTPTGLHFKFADAVEHGHTKFLIPILVKESR